MKKLILLLILNLTLNSCAQEKKCEDFKTGKFAYAEKNRPEKILRTENLQIEINPITGVEIHTNIEWTSDCEYVMTYKKILNHPKDISSVIGKKIFVQILETNGNKIKVRAKSDSMDEEIELIKTE
tara:strand:+ start:219 stop:596 length:378 start_codon:yes stop_codon:yes gene_type:complete